MVSEILCQEPSPVGRFNQFFDQSVRLGEDYARGQGLVGGEAKIDGFRSLRGIRGALEAETR
jgi:hypothetical protein